MISIGFFFFWPFVHISCKKHLTVRKISEKKRIIKRVREKKSDKVSGREKDTELTESLKSFF